MLNNYKIKEVKIYVSIKDKVKWLRQDLFEMFLQEQQEHPGSVLSQVEITVVMYTETWVSISVAA